MASFSLARRTLQRALDIVGDSSLLARRLHVPLDDLHSWLDGSDVPPRPVFFAAVDILCEPEENTAGKKRPADVAKSATKL